jgi:hypothetical protein
VIDSVLPFLIPSGFVKIDLLQEFVSYDLKRHPNVLHHISYIQFLIQLCNSELYPICHVPLSLCGGSADGEEKTQLFCSLKLYCTTTVHDL